MADKRRIYRRVLKISMPLVVSLGASTVMGFTDRLFLAHYSLDAIAAATPAGFMFFLFLSIFTGTAGYVSVFTAQYVGQNRSELIGRIVWQGVYVALLGAVVLALLSGCAEAIFSLAGHAPAVRELEIIYFQVLCLGAGLPLTGSVLSGFFTGLGRTRAVMIANLAGMIVNIPLDYCLINGVGPFPEWGIFGAGIATVCGWGLIVLLLLWAVRTQGHARYRLLEDRAFRPVLWLRLIRFGLPSGTEFFLDNLGFTVFVLVVGRLGTLELAASNIVMNIESLAFMPLIGFSLGVSTLTGQSLGEGRPGDVPSIVRAGLILAFGYLAFMSTLFLFMPEPILNLFRPRDADPAVFSAVLEMGRVLLLIVVAYLFFDGVSFIVYGALKGAGDTFFAMMARLVLVLGFMVLPLLVGAALEFGLFYFWGVCCVFLIVSALVSLWRYRQGKWRRMLVVEHRSVGTI